MNLRTKSPRTPGSGAPPFQAVAPHAPPSEEENWELRHGWDIYNSEEYLNMLHSSFYMYYTEKRHETGGRPKEDDKFSSDEASEDWRVKSRIKTVFAGLMLCLNLGVDPPDVVKTNPTAALEAWVDPSSPTSPSTKVMESIGKALQQQYETLSIRIRYRQLLDPSVDETRKCCVTLRRNSKEERVLFHYNGHGVPLPTPSGEVWYFNRKYTQYIPVSLYDLQLWLGGPSIYVLDVAHAGNVVANFGRFLEKHEEEGRQALVKDPSAQLPAFGENIILAACGKEETLPTNPNLPADLFTSCLTTPVAISLRGFLLQSQFPLGVSLKDLDKIPGRLQERRTPLGELNWIFTAITDTIAWNYLPRDLFKKLFRQDLMVAALFRNYLLADRLMRQNGCHPETEPVLPSTHEHPLWQSWDLALEMVLMQLPSLIASEEGGPPYEYQNSNFFAEQLTAFDVYLSQGALERRAPDQLPIVLQVLLSQVHRLRALVLLSRFLDLGPWAVHLALRIGIFPYVLKLLQSAAVELKPVLIFIWSRILAVDGSCQTDLLRDNGYRYFLNVLKPDVMLPVSIMSEHRAMSLFIIAMFCRNYQAAQVAVLSLEVFQDCIVHMSDLDDPLLRQWSCLCISMMWKGFPEAKWTAKRATGDNRLSTHQLLCQMVVDPVPEVRAAAVHALTTFLGSPENDDQVAQMEQAIASTIMLMVSDGNSMVRTELLVFFSTFIRRYEKKFIVAAYEELLDEQQRLGDNMNMIVENDKGKRHSYHRSRQIEEPKPPPSKAVVSKHSVHATMWKHLLILSVDPHADVAQHASLVTDYIHIRLLDSPLGFHAQALMDDLIRLSIRRPQSRPASPTPMPRVADMPAPTTPTTLRRNESIIFAGLRRTASAASAFKSLAFGAPNPMQNTPVPEASSSPTIDATRANGHVRARVPDEWSRPPDAHDPFLQSPTYQKARVPLPRGFKFTDRDKLIAASLHGAKEGAAPLRSAFFEWSVEYFREPQMKTSEQEEPGSGDWNSRLWRRTRNEKIIGMTQPLKNMAGSTAWDTHMSNFVNGSQPMRYTFHQFEDHLAVADDRDSICIWDWQAKRRLARFSNGNPAGSRVTEVRFINEDDQALLLTGSSDGVVKVYRDYDVEPDVELVSAFRGLTDLLPSQKNAGMVLDWQQGQGKLLVSGDVRAIRIWNVATEICTGELATRSNSPITALSSEQIVGDVFVAGLGNGKIQVYDQRQPPGKAMVQRYNSHQQWIVDVHVQRGGLREIVSASRGGEVKLWDVRKPEPLRTITATRNTLRSLSVHEHAPVFAIGSDTHRVNFFNTSGAFLNSVQPASAGFLHQQKTPMIATAFHPHRMMLACSSLHDQNVNIYTCTDNKDDMAE